MFDYLAFFHSYYLDVIYKDTHYRVIKASISHKNAVVCIYLLESQFLEEKSWKSFISEPERLFEAIESL